MHTGVEPPGFPEVPFTFVGQERSQFVSALLPPGGLKEVLHVHGLNWSEYDISPTAPPKIKEKKLHTDLKKYKILFFFLINTLM